jgi:DNA repair protein RecN (Recombination protein N)
MLRQGERDAARRSDMLDFAVQEIESAKVRPGEKAALNEERLRLANAERLADLATQAVAALDESGEPRPAAIERLGQAVHAAGELGKLDPSLAALAAELQGLEDQTAEASRTLKRYRDSLEFNPRRLEQVEQRLAALHDLERKYGEGEETILAYLDRSRQERESIAHAGERIAILEAEEAERLERIGGLGLALSRLRHSAAEKLSRGIEGELKDLHMAGARFAVDLHWDDDPDGAPADDRRVAFSRTGLDQAEFLVAPNPGEGLKPLAKIASGGETSRLMLGLKGVLARADETPTLIFDEIDQGIGGRVGGVVGEKLWRLARNHQVLCITHLPHWRPSAIARVEKVQRGGRTFTTVGPLPPDERLAELAQMLGGPGEANRQSAAELMREAEKTKTA